MPREDDPPMHLDHAFDQLIRDLHASDDTPDPGAAFVHALEARLAVSGRSRASTPQRSLALRWWPMASHPSARLTPSQRAARWANAATACLVAITLVAGTLGYRRLGGGASTPSSETVAAVSAAATPIPGGTPTTGSTGAASGKPTTCLADARPPGSVEAMLAATTWRVPQTFPVGGGRSPVLDGDYYTSQYGAYADGDDVDQFDDVIADLWACRMYTIGYAGSQDPDSRFWSHFSDNALRRVYGDIPASAGSALAALQPQPMTSWSSPPRVVRAFDVEDYEGAVPRVGVVVSPPSCGAASGRPQASLMLIFAFEGRWVIDEVATATFDDLGAAQVGATPDWVDISIFDERGGEADGSEALGGAYSCETVFYADQDVRVFVHNPGTIAHSIRFPTLGIYAIVQPNTSQLILVNAPSTLLEFEAIGALGIESPEASNADGGIAGVRIASVDYLVYEAGSTDPIGEGRLEFAPQGAARPKG